MKSEFNKNNDLIAETDAMGFRSVYQVDKLGNRIAQTDPRGHTTRLYYNERNQQIAHPRPRGLPDDVRARRGRQRHRDQRLS